jgi:hypothetical protein
MTVDPRELLDDVATGHPAVARRDAEGATVYEVGGQPIAVVAAASTEFRLRADMVRAALRTPGTTTSARGPEWVAFEVPPELERYDVDRLRSWFEMSARLAGG